MMAKPYMFTFIPLGMQKIWSDSVESHYTINLDHCTRAKDKQAHTNTNEQTHTYTHTETLKTKRQTGTHKHK